MARLLLGGSLGALSIALVTLPFAMSGAAGCATQETNAAPDAAIAQCDRGPFPFCAPVTADVPSCSTDEGNSPWLTRLERGKNYPVGCVVNYVGERDPQGDCKLEASCTCIVRSTPVTPVDSGTEDAGSDAEAGAPPPPPPPASTSRPTWSCFP